MKLKWRPRSQAFSISVPLYHSLISLQGKGKIGDLVTSLIPTLKEVRKSDTDGN